MSGGIATGASKPSWPASGLEGFFLGEYGRHHPLSLGVS